MGLIVEMLGAPGAGKTTIVPLVEQRCREAALVPYTPDSAARVLAARTVLGRLVARALPARHSRSAMWAVFRLTSGLHSGRFAIANPRLTAYVLRSQWRRDPGADAAKRRVIYWYARTMGTYALAKAHLRDSEVIIFDEGFAHRAVQLFSSVVESPTSQAIERYVGLLPAPDVLVHVVARPQTCSDRVKSRGVWQRLAHREDPELDRFVDHAHRATTLVRRAAADLGWPIIEVDNELDRADAAHPDTAPAPPLLSEAWARVVSNPLTPSVLGGTGRG